MSEGMIKDFFGMCSTEGDAHSTVEKALIKRFGQERYDSIRKTSRLQELVYCATRISSSGSSDGQDRPPHTPGSVNHDFVLLKMTAKGSQYGADPVIFHMKTEKRGGSGGGAGGGAGIYVDLLDEDQVKHIHGWRFAWWDCGSIQVPLDNLIQTLQDHDKNYQFLTNNCWVYAKAACKSVLLFLSEQPTLPNGLASYLYWQGQARLVKTVVKTKAALGALASSSSSG